MRGLFKELLKASGTPVLQTDTGGVETILSAGNIWTSAHARRIDLSERGLAPGGVLCSEVGGFQAVIDFVACTIGGFIYLPVTPARALALRRDLATSPIACEAGIMFVGGGNFCTQYPASLPRALASILAVDGAQLALYRDDAHLLREVAVMTGEQLADWLARMSRQLDTPMGGTRLTCSWVHHDFGFVADLLLGMCNRQTIYIRQPARCAAQTVLREAIDLEVDDLVLAPAMFDGIANLACDLGSESWSGLQNIRLHTGGHELSDRHAQIASALFGRVFVDVLAPSDVSRATSMPAQMQPEAA